MTGWKPRFHALSQAYDKAMRFQEFDGLVVWWFDGVFEDVINICGSDVKGHFVSLIPSSGFLFASILKRILNCRRIQRGWHWHVPVFIWVIPVTQISFVNWHVGTVLHGSCVTLRDVSAVSCRYLRDESEFHREIAGTLGMAPYLFNPARSPLKVDIPNKYPLYKVYMGLTIRGTIPRVRAFSLWELQWWDDELTPKG